MKKGLLCSTILLLIGVFLIANAFADTPRKPVSPSFEQLGKSSPASARSPLSAQREMLGATLNVPSVLYPTIEAAVAAANPGDQIVVAAGTYPISAQVVIDEDLTITGAGSALTTITTSFSTGGSGSAKGWFWVQPGIHFDLSGVTLDGAGQLVFQAIRDEGVGGTVHDVVFKNIKYNPSSDYAGTAIVAFGTGPVNVADCVFSQIGRVGVLYYGPGVNGSAFTGNTYTGKGPGDWLDYGLEAGAGAVVTVDNCRISGCRGVASVDGSVSAAIIATTLYGEGTGETITHCDLTDNTYGIGIGADASDASTVVAHYNGIYGNDYGIDSTNPTVDALNNWWGDASGPSPTGTGNGVSANVTFSPWVTIPNDISVVPVYTLTNCTDKKTVTFHIAQEASIDVRGYEVKFQVNPAVVTVANPAADIIEKDFLSSVGGTNFFVIDNGGGVYTVSCAIAGGDVGASGSGDLFSVLLTPFAAGSCDIAFVRTKVRDLNNAPLPSSSVKGTIQLDCTYPTMEPIAPTEGGWYNAAPVFSNFGFDDNLNLDLAEYKIDGGAWNTIFTGINSASWDSDGWVLPGFADPGLSQGSHTVYFRVKDDAGNWNGEGGSQPNLYSWQFNKDTVPPAPPTNFVAMPGNNKTHLTWTNPTGDDTFVGVEIRVNPWGGYPEYGTPGPPGEPSYPANHSEGTLVALVAGALYTVDPLPRDIYYYSAFSKDLAGNYSSTIVGASDRTTSYWLGDVVADGLVDMSDLAPFSNTFGRSSGQSGWNNLCDFGPTDDNSRFGTPQPDNTIDFEDLMIFSMNWGRVAPAGLGTFIAARAAEDLGSLVRLEIVPGTDNIISVVLKNQSTTLKGLHLVVKADGDVLRIDRGSLLAGRSDVFFGTLPGGTGTADICVAALGTDTPLLSKATGEIARLTVKQGDAPLVVRLEKADLRNLDNGKTELVVAGNYEAPFVPKATALMQNYPNPFNPATTLTFDVSQAGNVTIQLYDVSGRLVASLLDGHKDVGRHHVAWNGKDSRGSSMPSGIYFCRMTAPGFKATMKMILVR